MPQQSKSFMSGTYDYSFIIKEARRMRVGEFQTQGSHPLVESETSGLTAQLCAHQPEKRTELVSRVFLGVLLYSCDRTESLAMDLSFSSSLWRSKR